MKDDISDFKVLISHEEIKTKIFQMSQIIDDEYNGKEIQIIMILKGSFIFASDFVREIKTPFTIDTLSCSSYGNRGKKQGKLLIQGLDEVDVKSKNILLIDDIFDNGKTINTVKEELFKKEPLSIKTLVLLLKKKRRLENVQLPDYYMFELENKFVIGYGLDYKEYFRGLKDIYSIE